MFSLLTIEWGGGGGGVWKVHSISMFYMKAINYLSHPSVITLSEAANFVVIQYNPPMRNPAASLSIAGLKTKCETVFCLVLVCFFLQLFKTTVLCVYHCIALRALCLRRDSFFKP